MVAKSVIVFSFLLLVDVAMSSRALIVWEHAYQKAVDADLGSEASTPCGLKYSTSLLNVNECVQNATAVKAKVCPGCSTLLDVSLGDCTSATSNPIIEENVQLASVGLQALCHTNKIIASSAGLTAGIVILAIIGTCVCCCILIAICKCLCGGGSKGRGGRGGDTTTDEDSSYFDGDDGDYGDYGEGGDWGGFGDFGDFGGDFGGDGGDGGGGGGCGGGTE